MAVIKALLNHLKEVTLDIDSIVNEGYDLGNIRDRMAILHLLQIQAQTIIDIVQRILSIGGRSKEGYREALRAAHQMGLVNSEEYAFLNSLVGFRNIIIHEYVKVDLSIIEDVLRRREYRRALEVGVNIVERARRMGLTDP